MNWFYVYNAQRYGPVDEPDFQRMVQQGTITATTLVWQPGMANWQPLKTVLGSANSLSAPGQQIHFCCQCGRCFQSDDMLQFQDAWVCAQCKSVFFQRIREGVDVGGILGLGNVEYAGFWIRAGAYMLDAIIIGAIAGAVDAGADIDVFPMFLLVTGLAGIYETYFVGSFGATLGKMALGLRIVTESGAKMTFMRAFGRFWGKMLSWFTLTIGFLLAAADPQKRTLHDHLCETRVVRR